MVSSPAAPSRLGTSGGTGSGTNTAAQVGATNVNANGAASIEMGSLVLSAAFMGLGWAVGRHYAFESPLAELRLNGETGDVISRYGEYGLGSVAQWTA